SCEWIVFRYDEIRVLGIANVLKITDPAVAVRQNQVKITVAVQVSKLGRSSSAGYLAKGIVTFAWILVLPIVIDEIDHLAVRPADEEIEVAVAIDVAKRWRDCIEQPCSLEG